MSWPVESAPILGTPRRGRRRRRRGRGITLRPEVNRGRFQLTARGLYRVFNATEYRFYRSNTGPPLETDTPFATNATLPHEPTDLYADGTWYLSMSYFNGVIDSGFLPVGPNGETYLRLDLDTGAETGAPPNPPTTWTIHATKKIGSERGVRLRAVYFQVGALRATEWAWWRSILGDFRDPDILDPDSTAVMVPASGPAVLDVDSGLFGPFGDIEQNVLLRTRRNDGTVGSPIWVYSENIVYQGVIADGTVPTTPAGGELWTGRLPDGTT